MCAAMQIFRFNHVVILDSYVCDGPKMHTLGDAWNLVAVPCAWKHGYAYALKAQQDGCLAIRANGIVFYLLNVYFLCGDAGFQGEPLSVSPINASYSCKLMKK
jgi:hypothetical protein